MRIRPPIVMGVVMGLAAGLVVIGEWRAARAAQGVMLPDFGGPVQGVVMQYARGSEFVAPVFRDYLKWQGADVTVYMACPDEAAFAEIRGLLGEAGAKCKMIPVYTHHVMTAWSRDRWVAMDAGGSGMVTVVSQLGELSQDIWPERAGDSGIGEDLAKAFPAVFAARRSGLNFDGGDFLADGGKVFVTRAVVERNLQHTVATRDDLVRAIEKETGCEPVLMDGAPDHHAGMYMMAAGMGAGGKRVMMVADPSLGKSVYAASAERDGRFVGGPDFSAATQGQFDWVAQLAEKEGYEVRRMPVVPGHGKMFMTYVNVILDEVAGKRVVYMSSYAGQEAMNAAAAKVWEGAGFEVRPVECGTVWEKGGTLHCLVNVFARGKI